MSPQAIDPSKLTAAELFSATEDLELIAECVVEGFLHGLHQSPFLGFSVEFASHREYMPGDDLRHVNWRLYGRHERLFVKEYDADTNVDLHLVVDSSASMMTEGKWECASVLAAALVHLSARQRDAVGLTLFADAIRCHLRPRGTADHRQEILHQLARQPERSICDSPEVLHEVSELLPRRGVTVLISDFYYPEDQLDRVIGHFRDGGDEVILFHVLTPLEKQLPVSGSIRFRDSETGQEVVTDVDAIREEFTAAVQSWQADLQQICLRHEFDYVALSTDTPLPGALREYFRMRGHRW
ncbi:DUF58 domain-containing protein [Roseiconus nitratireducens]|uniref:DUF58 domain-containing protein n=1 Tax=Roseiconus nitratireducens TaxID=2605748 RepID=A0A5M6D8E0_9BACT|nr:DUF58 domain-containing protein [Roseiconus nitratireducens]KAA5541445.1 DUF58 domain-containing protein [Roseiconus nitratireducens]